MLSSVSTGKPDFESTLMLSNTLMWNQSYGNQKGWAAKSHTQSQISREQNWGWRLKLGFGEAFERLNVWISDWMIFHFIDTLTDALGSIESNPLDISINTNIFHYGQYLNSEYMNYECQYFFYSFPQQQLGISKLMQS